MLTQPIDLASLRYLPCRDQRARSEPWMSICIHETQSPEVDDAAWKTALYLQNPPQTAGIHISADNKSAVWSAYPEQTVPHCYRPSGWSIGIECAGYTDTTGEGWHDTYSQNMLAVVASICGGLIVPWEAAHHQSFPLVHIGGEQVGAKASGFFSHYDSTMACLLYGWDPNGRHVDGRWCPWEQLADLTADDIRRRKGVEPEDEDAMPKRWAYDPAWAVPGGAFVEVDEIEKQCRAYSGSGQRIALSFDGQHPADVMTGDPGLIVAIDLNDTRLMGSNGLRYTYRPHDDANAVVFVANGGFQYRITAIPA